MKILFLGFEREKGRENGSFPVAEILKPLGFRKFCGCKILFNSERWLQKNDCYKHQ